MQWVDIFIIIVAILGAPHLRTMLEWFLAGGPVVLLGRFALHQQPPEPQNLVPPGHDLNHKVRHLEDPRERTRYGLFHQVTDEELDAMFVDHDKRRAFLETLEWSFPVDDVQISHNGPVTIKWDAPLDDFWFDDNFDPRRILDTSAPQHYYIDEMTPPVYQAAVEQFQQTQQTIQSLTWQKLPTRMGICYRQMDNNVCAVHRWDARDVESQALLGRVQCWNDASLLTWKPEFVLERPEFNESMGGGTVCMAEVRDSVVVVGCPMSHAMVYGNVFLYQHSHGENEWDLTITDETTVDWVFSQMSEFGLHVICDCGGCMPEPQAEVDEPANASIE